jgi:hypothetical protein
MTGQGHHQPAKDDRSMYDHDEKVNPLTPGGLSHRAPVKVAWPAAGIINRQR